MFHGNSVNNITKAKHSDVFSSVDQTIVGIVTVPQALIDDKDALPLGTILTSKDAGVTWEPLTTPEYSPATYADGAEVYYQGHIFKSTVADNDTVPGTGDWDDLGIWDANGILYNDLTESKKTTIVVTGTVKGKYLHGGNGFLRAILFKNKIIAK